MPLPQVAECQYCGKEYFPKTWAQTTCGSRECRLSGNKDGQIIRKHESFKKREETTTTNEANDRKAMTAVKDAVLSHMYRDIGYHRCEECLKTKNKYELDCHHLVFRSEIRGNPKRHDKRNLLIVCRECHALFHTIKKLRQKWVDSRGLYDLFPEVVRKSE